MNYEELIHSLREENRELKADLEYWRKGKLREDLQAANKINKHFCEENAKLKVEVERQNNRIKNLEEFFKSTALRVLPGETDSIDALLNVWNENAKLLAEVERLEDRLLERDRRNVELCTMVKSHSALLRRSLEFLKSEFYADSTRKFLIEDLENAIS